jgi:hypothetical protein
VKIMDQKREEKIEDCREVNYKVDSCMILYILYNRHQIGVSLTTRHAHCYVWV